MAVWHSSAFKRAGIQLLLVPQLIEQDVFCQWELSAKQKLHPYMITIYRTPKRATYDFCFKLWFSWFRIPKTAHIIKITASISYGHIYINRFYSIFRAILGKDWHFWAIYAKLCFCGFRCFFLSVGFDMKLIYDGILLREKTILEIQNNLLD